MSIYKKRTRSHIYRKIYEQHYGIIPKDSLGRTYEIHHIDGDSNNNDPSNLVALSIQEHYDVHYSQGDWIECVYIARYRLNFTKLQLSELARKQALERVENGTNPFQKRPDGTSLASDRVKNGTHNLTKRSDGTSLASDMVAKGTHVCLNKGKRAPRYDHRIHHFHNEAENIFEMCTQYDLRLKYPYLEHSRGRLSALVNGKNGDNAVKGWKKLP
jgi:hypothetical protein